MIINKYLKTISWKIEMVYINNYYLIPQVPPIPSIENKKFINIGTKNITTPIINLFIKSFWNFFIFWSSLAPIAFTKSIILNKINNTTTPI